MFKPDFNKNSKWILKRKQQEELVKKEIGKSKNVDYYEVMPKGSLEQLDHDTLSNNRY